MTLASGTLVRFGPPTNLQNKLVAVVVLLRRQDPAGLAVIDVSTGSPRCSPDEQNSAVFMGNSAEIVARHAELHHLALPMCETNRTTVLVTDVLGGRGQWPEHHKTI